MVGGSIRSSADVVKAFALGADAVYIATGALLALGCHLCRSCQTGRCNWGIATQIPELTHAPEPRPGLQASGEPGHRWNLEIKEMMGGMGINAIEALRGNRAMLRGVSLTDKELEILGVRPPVNKPLPSPIAPKTGVQRTLRPFAAHPRARSPLAPRQTGGRI